MNKRFNSIVSLFGVLTLSSHAFTLDAAGYEGRELARYPVTLWVPGYGEVVLETEMGAALVVDPGYGSGRGFSGIPLGFNSDDAVKISFTGRLGGDVEPLGKVAGNLARATVWNAIPEPASAGLGMVGVVALLLGRRR